MYHKFILSLGPVQGQTHVTYQVRTANDYSALPEVLRRSFCSGDQSIGSMSPNGTLLSVFCRFTGSSLLQ